jgi:hypothetical protein
MHTLYVTSPDSFVKSASVQFPAGQVTDMEALETFIKNYKRAADGQNIYYPEKVTDNYMTVELDAGVMVGLRFSNETPKMDMVNIHAWDIDTNKPLDVLHTNESRHLMTRFENLR